MRVEARDLQDEAGRYQKSEKKKNTRRSQKTRDNDFFLLDNMERHLRSYKHDDTI